jgi:hypothetical protein
MAGSKSAASKKKKQHNSVSPEVKDVQTWMAGAPTDNVERLAKYVGEKLKRSSSRSVLLGCLSLLLKRPELATAKATEPASRAAQHTDDQKLILLQLLQTLVLEAGRLLQSATAAAADGKKPSVVLAWATMQGLQKLAEYADASEQLEFWEAVIRVSEPFIKVTDPQQWLEQWDSPADYTLIAEHQEEGKSSEQLVAELGSEVVRCYVAGKLKVNKEAAVAAFFNLRKELKVRASAKCDISIDSIQRAIQSSHSLQLASWNTDGR